MHEEHGGREHGVFVLEFAALLTDRTRFLWLQSYLTLKRTAETEFFLSRISIFLMPFNPNPRTLLM